MLALGVMMALTSGAVAVTSSDAGNYRVGNYRVGPCQYGQELPCPTVDKHLTYFFGAGLSSDMRSRINESRLWSFEAVSNWSTSVTTNHDRADLHFLGENLPGDTLGLYRCSVVQGSRCGHGHIRFDEAAMDSFEYGVASRRGLACHETGHGVGLLHPLATEADTAVHQCMMTRVNPWPSGLGSHNAAHLNQSPWYG